MYLIKNRMEERLNLKIANLEFEFITKQEICRLSNSLEQAITKTALITHLDYLNSLIICALDFARQRKLLHL